MSTLLHGCWSMLMVCLALAPSAGAEPGFQDPLPPGALHRLGTLRFRQPGQRPTVALAPDGRVLALAGLNSPVRLLDVATGKELRRLPGPVESLAFDPQGAVLAGTAGRAGMGFRPLDVWDRTTARLLCRIDRADLSPKPPLPPSHAREHVGSFGQPSLSAGGQRLAAPFYTGIESTQIIVWEVATARQILRIEKPSTFPLPKFPLRTALSPDGQLLATFIPADFWSGKETEGRDCVVVWDVATGKEKQRFRCDGISGWQAVAFAPDGKSLAAAAMGQDLLVWWDLATGQERGRFATRHHDLGQVVIQFAPDGRRLAVAGPGAVVVSYLAGRNRPFADPGAVQVWDVATGRRLGQSVSLPASPPSLAFTADGRVLAVALQNNTAMIYDVLSDKLLTPVRGHVSRVLGLSFSADSQELTSLAADGQTVFRWNATTGQPIEQLALGDQNTRYTGSYERFSAAVFAPDRPHVLATEDNSGVGLFELPQGREVAFVVGRLTFPYPVALAADGTRLAVANMPRLIGVYDVGSGMEVCRVKDLPEDILCLAFAPDGRSLVVVSVDRPGEKSAGIRVLETATGKVRWQNIQKSQVPSRGVVTFTPDGKAVVLLDYDGTVFFYDSATGHEFRRVTGIAPYALLVFSPNGRTFATVEGLKYQSNQVRVWETVSGTVRHQFPGPEGGLFALAFAPDSCRLATGGGDTTILVWDLIRGTEAPSRQGRPSVDEWEKIWAQLGAPEARVGHQAMCRMLDAPETAVGFLKTRLKGQLEPAQRLARALEVLEWIDTAQTRELLQSWAQRYPDTALGQAARETFDRLARRPVRQASNK